MTVKRTITTVYLLITIMVLTVGYQLAKNKFVYQPNGIEEMGYESTLPTSLYMYNLLEDKSEEYGIPKHILYNVAYLETRYCGPFHVNYNPHQRSYAGAVGPMQIITRYSHSYAGRRPGSPPPSRSSLRPRCRPRAARRDRLVLPDDGGR